MNTVTLVVNKLVEKYEYTHFADESAVIAEIGKILIESFGKTQARFIANSDYFLGEALDSFYTTTGAK
jgi:hemerythrin